MKMESLLQATIKFINGQEYFENLHSKNLENLDKFLTKYNLKTKSREYKHLNILLQPTRLRDQWSFQGQTGSLATLIKSLKK